MDLVTRQLASLAATAQEGWLLAVLFVAVMLIVAGVVGLMGGRDRVQARLASGAPGTGSGTPATLRVGGEERLKRFDRFVAPSDPARRGAMRLKMQRAGYRGDSAIRIFHLVRAVLALGLAAAVSVGAPLLTDRLTPVALFGLSMAGCAVGFLLPGLWLRIRADRRREAIRDSFPDALDMLLVCVEAGQGLDQALARVAAELQRAHPVLAEEFLIVCSEQRAGKERRNVLRDLASRADLDDLGAFVTVLVQADQFGTSVADALRVYAAEMRHKRMMRAEEKANKLPMKLALGTIVFTLPPVMLILAGPSAVMIFRALTGMAR